MGVCKLRNLLVLVMLFISSPVFCQVFATVDADTYELIENVNYSLYKNKKAVYSGVTLPDRLTGIDKAIEFDSISFSRLDYKVLGLAKSEMDTLVLLTKNVIHLDEVVISSGKDKGMVLGETNRFVKRRSRALLKDLQYGSVFTNILKERLQLDIILFYVNKAALKTAYRVHVLEVEETALQPGYRIAKPGEPIFSTDTLYLQPKDKKAEIDVPPGLLLTRDKPVFVWIQLLGYYGKDGKELDPDLDDVTKLKFQLSSEDNYYSKWTDVNTKQVVSGLINENIRIKHDFVTMYFEDPHKSNLVAPAVLLYCSKVQK